MSYVVKLKLVKFRQYSVTYDKIFAEEQLQYRNIGISKVVKTHVLPSERPYLKKTTECYSKPYLQFKLR